MRDFEAENSVLRKALMACYERFDDQMPDSLHREVVAAIDYRAEVEDESHSGRGSDG